MDLPTMRTCVETDLKDTTNSRWSDDEINRAIARAVSDYQEASPYIAKVSIAMGASRWFDLSGQSGYLWCEAVEFPVDDTDGSQGAPSLRLFREERALQRVWVLGKLPAAGENVRFWYAKPHTLDASGSTIPAEHEDLIALGAAGYAALELAINAVDRLNASASTPGHWREWAEWRLQEFAHRLQAIRDTRTTGPGTTIVTWASAVV
jgi:hypothetical protein